MVFSKGVQQCGSRSAARARLRRCKQGTRKPRLVKERDVPVFDGTPATPSAFRFVWRSADLADRRLVLGDLRRVLVFGAHAYVLAPSDHQVGLGCLSCAVQHEPRNFDCAGQRIRPAHVPRGRNDEVGYCPLTGLAVGSLRLLGEPSETRHRRLTHQACTFTACASQNPA